MAQRQHSRSSREQSPARQASLAKKGEPMTGSTANALAQQLKSEGKQCTVYVDSRGRGMVNVTHEGFTGPAYTIS